jgi:hypothetical protein
VPVSRRSLRPVSGWPAPPLRCSSRAMISSRCSVVRSPVDAGRDAADRRGCAMMIGMTVSSDVHERPTGDAIKIWFKFVPREG